MFSEKEIINQCRQCRENCDRISRCPLKAYAKESGDAVPDSLDSRGTASAMPGSLCGAAADDLSFEVLLAGLLRLNNCVRSTLNKRSGSLWNLSL